MTYRYTIFEQQLFEEHIGYYRTFGIEGCVRTDSGWQPCIRLPDVSVDREFTRRLAGRCTSSQLSPVHLKDAVLDALP